MEVGDYFGGKDDENIANIYDLLANNGADLKAADNNGKSARYALQNTDFFSIKISV